ncbi:MAG TPA: PD-(D/E)XK nuclease family protein, partial [Alphaproteobacteria bacterium]|nr:PD-(D/E)XK nuclease family protein [Alphaproteobacteria bacterium]
YRRLLYVALTRAANRLYIGGWETKRSAGEAAGDSWHALVAGALKDLHEAHAVEDGREPAPLIAFADPVFGGEKTGAGKSAAEKSEPLPKWARRPPPIEPALPKRVAPSKIAAFAAPWAGEVVLGEPVSAPPDRRFLRGRIIHRLLEGLPGMEDARRDAAASRYLANPQHRLGAEEQAEILREVLDLLRDPAFAPLFGPDSRAEVPLAGIVAGKEIVGQVDRLCVTEDAVWIVDYKSNRPPPARVEDVLEAYRAQLFAYRDVLKAVYPGKAVRCFLLWTYVLPSKGLMEVE